MYYSIRVPICKDVFFTFFIIFSKNAYFFVHEEQFYTNFYIIATQFEFNSWQNIVKHAAHF